MTITETTDIYGNKAEKIDYVEFSWDSFQVTDWKFSDLIELIRDDDQAQIVAADIRQSFMDRYRQEVENLPQVCEPGKQCRREILEVLKANISVLTQDAVTQIQQAIETTVKNTRKHLKSAYEDAYYCDHGCECQFVENTYTYLLTQIEEHETRIEGWKNEQTVLFGRIESVPYECEKEFSGIRDEYEAKWAAMDAENQAQINALADWTADGWEMDSAVDQERFYEEFGFRYSAERFDKFYENEEYAAAIADIE